MRVPKPVIALAALLCTAAVGYQAFEHLRPHAEVAHTATRDALRDARGTKEGMAMREAALDDIEYATTDAMRVDAIELLGFVGSDDDIEMLADLVDHGTDPVRVAAVGAIGRIGGSEAVDVLLPIAGASDPMLSGPAYMALATTGEPEAADHILAAARDGRDPWISAPAAARLGTPEAAEVLAKHFLHGPSLDAPAYAMALATFDAQAIPEAREALDDGMASIDSNRRSSALSALAAARDPELFDTLADLARDPARQPEVCNALSSLRDPRGVPVLYDIATGGNINARWSALYALASFGTPESQAAMLDLVQNGSPDLAGAAIGAMANVTDPDTTEILVEAARTRPPYVAQTAEQRLFSAPWGDDVPDDVMQLARERVADQGPMVGSDAFALLLNHGDDDDIEAVEDAIADAPSMTRAQAAIALGSVDQPWARELLLDLVGDPDQNVAGSAINVCLQGDTKMRQRLESALLDAVVDDPNWNVANGLAQLGTPAAADALMDLLSDGSPADASIAASALSSYANSDMLHRVADVVPSLEPQVRQQIYGSLLWRSDLDIADLAEEALADDDAYIRTLGVQALGRNGDADASDRLVELADDDDPSVRAAAMDALVNLGGPQAEALAIDGLDDPETAGTAASALGRLGTPRAREALAHALTDSDDPGVRQQALWALATNPARGTEGLLAKGLRDDDPGVRSAAISSLQTVGTSEAGDQLVGLLSDSDDPDAHNEAVQAAYALQQIGGRPYREHKDQIDRLASPSEYPQYGGYYPYGGEEFMGLDDGLMQLDIEG